MSVKSINLAWVVVKDIKKAIKFYQDVVGLKLMEFDEKYGWAEFSGQDGEGAILGVAQQNDFNHIAPGNNAVVTLSVENLDREIARLTKVGAKLVGKKMEVPGHVKLQTIVDVDGNHFQLAEMLN